MNETRMSIMKMLDQIKHRKSIRSYNGMPFSQEDKERFMLYAAGLSNPYGLTPQFRILDAGKYGLSSRVITGADTFIAGKIK